jgi:hypothetical protein
MPSRSAISRVISPSFEFPFIPLAKNAKINHRTKSMNYFAFSETSLADRVRMIDRQQDS